MMTDYINDEFLKLATTGSTLPPCEVPHNGEENPECSGMAVARFHVTHAKKSVLGCNNTLRVVLDGLREGKECTCGKPETECLVVYPI